MAERSRLTVPITETFPPGHRITTPQGVITFDPSIPHELFVKLAECYDVLTGADIGTQQARAVVGKVLDGETRITDPVTGGQKGQKLAQLGAIDPNALLELAKVAGFGAQKYERNNFLRGYAWSLSFDALMRHMLAFAAGENVDPESGQLHTAHAAWHALALTAFVQRAIGTDDRI